MVRNGCKSTLLAPSYDDANRGRFFLLFSTWKRCTAVSRCSGSAVRKDQLDPPGRGDSPSAFPKIRDRVQQWTYISRVRLSLAMGQNRRASGTHIYIGSDIPCSTTVIARVDPENSGYVANHGDIHCVETETARVLELQRCM